MREESEMTAYYLVYDYLINNFCVQMNKLNSEFKLL